jgi:hypothetical protein
MRAFFDPVPPDRPSAGPRTAGGDPLADLLADALDDPPADEARI